MKDNTLIPHFVADRPMSLRILSGIDLDRHPVKLGLMIQACSSNNFREMVSRFPCVDLDYCGVVDGKCPFAGDIQKCKKGRLIQENFTIIADSGVFTKEGATLSYPELFYRYNQMKVERGIILDVLKDKDKTIESAKIAMELYSEMKCNFKLIGVAQGETPEEYLDCYNELRKLGYEEIAIGGLLTKHESTARYASSKKEEIKSIVQTIRNEWPDDRCFTLGVYNPKRHEFLGNLGVNAADYKGWLFQYKKRYSDPRCHHVDRVHQTRCFIEKKILSKISGIEASCDTINSTAERVKNNIVTRGSRIFVKTEVSAEISDHNKKNQVVIISCGKAKNPIKRCPARNAYNGRSFLLKKRYAEISNLPWFILSAKYGLIRPDKVIDPDYDMTINTKKDCIKLTNKIKRQIPHYLECSIADEILFLGPEKYSEALEISFKDKSIEIVHLTKGLNQGQSQKKIKEFITSGSFLSNSDAERVSVQEE